MNRKLMKYLPFGEGWIKIWYSVEHVIEELLGRFAGLFWLVLVPLALIYSVAKWLYGYFQ